MVAEERGGNWKLELRHGRRTTPFQHFTLIADGEARGLLDDFDCRPGAAVMSMKAWASDEAEAFDMIRAIGAQIGFSVSGRIQLYVTEPEAPPGTNPHGYDIRFFPYDEKNDDDDQ